MNFYCKVIKRVLDFLLAFGALIILSPIILVTALLVRIKLGSPVIYIQKRPGKDEKIFNLYKFRTMTDEKDSEGNLLPDSVRLTPFGRKLRSLSLDELPEFINIIKGDMAIVGPRPLRVQYLPYYTEEERKRHSVLPGLTGAAQVHGRNATSWEERFSYDVKYAENVTFLGDLKIILETVKVVFKRSGIGERGVDSPIDFDEYRRMETEKEYELSRR